MSCRPSLLNRACGRHRSGCLVRPQFQKLISTKLGMPHTIKPFALLLPMAVLLFAGCSGGTAKPTAASGNPAKADPAKAGPPKPLLDSGVPQTADAALHAVLDGLKANKPVALWNAIPKSQRHYIEQFIQRLAASIDPEVWNRTVQNLKKLVKLAETKKEWLLANPLLHNKQINFDDLKAGWDPGVALLKTVVDSELTDRERMTKFDGTTFFEGTGAKLYAEARGLSRLIKDDPLNRLDGVKFTLKEKVPTVVDATLEIPGPKPEKTHLELQIDEGQWTAQPLKLLSLAIQFKVAWIGEPFMPYVAVEWRDKYLKDMDRIGKTLDALQSAKTADEFKEIVALRVITLAGLIQGEIRNARKPIQPWEEQSRGRKKDQAFVMIAGEHESDEQDVLAITKVLRAHGAGKEDAYFAGPNRVTGATIYVVGPVTDIKALADEIKAGKITEVDAKRNLLKISVANVPSSDKAAADAGPASKGT
jgi:hypothetical protein